MRIVSILLMCLFILPSYGCVTQSRRDWGYVDLPGTSYPQASTVYVPLGNTVPQGVANMQGTVTPVAPNFAQPYVTVTNPNRYTYEHNSEIFDANTLINLGFLGLGITDTVLRYHHLNSHPHRWFRW